jgi:hypothetical protein
MLQEWWSMPDTFLEWEQSLLAIFAMVIAFSIFSRFTIRTFLSIGGIIFFGTLAVFVNGITHDTWDTWQSLAIAAVGIGIILSIVLAPFVIIEQFERRIKKLENDLALESTK